MQPQIISPPKLWVPPPSPAIIRDWKRHDLHAMPGRMSLLGAGRRAATAPPVFSPADLSPMLWLEADDLSTLFQSNAGSTAVASNADPVGYWGDKSGNGFHLTSVADNTTRPTYGTDGTYHWVAGDGSNDLLRRTAALGMHAAGACSIFIAMRSDAAVTRFLFGERSSSTGNPVYQVMSGQVDLNDLMFTIRNDAGSFNLSLNLSFADNVLDDTDFVYGVTDSGSTAINYDNGSQVDSDSYTRSGSLTANRTSLFGAFASDTPAEWFAGRVYALVVVGRVIDSTERANLVTYLGNKMGLSL